MKTTQYLLCYALFLGVCLAGTAHAQTLSMPPSGDNQQATVIQQIGIAEVKIVYNSPDVSAPDGSSRRGKIWGQLVPYGLNDLGFGLGNPAPWRAGANENTVFSVSHNVLIDGRALPAGEYGFHVIVNPEEWTLIFSQNSTAWGSYFYDEKEDALRVTVKPEKNEYTEWLSYDFIERRAEYAVCALKWEDLRVTFKVEVPNMSELYVARMRQELQSVAGFNWQNWVSAVNFCVTRKTNLEEALKWADTAIEGTFVGQRNYTTLQAKAKVLEALGRTQESETVVEEALAHPTATPMQVHTYARQLLLKGEKERAMKIYQLNADKHPNTWPTDYGLARGYAAMGNFQKALKHARLALEQAPDEQSRRAIEADLEKLRAGRDIN